MKPKNSSSHFVLCVQNEGEDDLILRKIYQVLPDNSAAIDGLLRVVDESGEDYLYPASHFVSLDLPPKIQRALAGKSEALLQTVIFPNTYEKKYWRFFVIGFYHRSIDERCATSRGCSFD